MPARTLRDPLTAAYAFLLAACLFLWPVTAGIAEVPQRLGWLMAACALTLVSLVAFRRAVTDAPRPLPASDRVPLPAMIAAACVVLFLGAGFPPVAFGDEPVIAAGGLTLASMLARIFTWPGLFVAFVAGLGVLTMFVRRSGLTLTLIMLFLAVAVGAVSAAFMPTSGIALRYPPLVHLAQAVASVLTLGAPQLFRGPNVLWTLLLMTAAWKLTPGWSLSARWALLAGIILGPFGWTYRIVLYQACGELTLGIIALLLFDAIGKQPKARWLGALLGAVCAMWVLYRPTALAAVVVLLALLALRRRWSACIDAAFVAMPVAGAWLALAPLYTAQYGIVSDDGGLLPFKSGSVFTPLIAALKALPDNLHPAGLAVLVASIFAAFIVAKDKRWMLFAAASIAVLTGAAQNFITDPLVYGTARYSILLLPAQGIALAGLADVPKRWTRALTAACIIVLAVITPWHFVRFAQEQRLPGRDILRATTEGYLITPLPDVVRTSVANGEQPRIVAPDYQFLEVLTAADLITPQQRAAMAVAGAAWTPSDPQRPVIIQAPTDTTYRPNLPEAAETRLREARTWALAQPGVRTVRLGLEETVVVP